MSCCTLQLFSWPTCQRQWSRIYKWDRDIRVESFADHRMLYKILGLSLQDVVSTTEGLRPRHTYPNSPANTLNSLHLRGEAVLLLVTIDIGSHGRGVMLLTIRAAGHERTHLSRPHKWRMV